jgi:hypothetical protein
MSAIQQQHPKRVTAGAVLLMLAACGGGSGGGGGGSTPAGASTPPPTDTRPTTKVVDGPIGNANVFLDRNANGVLDAGEPSARTDAAGIARWDIGADELVSAPLVAQVGADAIDADHGAVTRAYTLSAPAGSVAVVSPLTTLLQRVIEQSGLPAAQAEAALKSRTAIASLSSDYSVDTSATGREAALTARLTVLSLQQQGERLAAQIGSPDAGGTAITSADVEHATLDSVVRNIHVLAQAARDSSLQSVCGTLGSADCATALQAQAVQQMDASGLTSATLPVHAAAWRIPATKSPGVAALNLSEFAYGDADNWYWRATMSTAQEATPDAQGRSHYRQLRRLNTNGAVVEWGHGPTYARRDDTHWTGSGWQTCPATQAMSQGERDDQGIAANTDYCNGMQTNSNRRWVADLAGRDMMDVTVAMRDALPNTMGSWGFPPAGFSGSSNPALGGAVFPTGAKLFAQTVTTTSTAPVFMPSAPVRVYSPEVAAGGEPVAIPAMPATAPSRRPIRRSRSARWRCWSIASRASRASIPRASSTAAAARRRFPAPTPASGGATARSASERLAPRRC